jgi:putative tryptophan/tyrosine transport system substrate-binding protein
MGRTPLPNPGCPARTRPSAVPAPSLGPWLCGRRRRPRTRTAAPGFHGNTTGLSLLAPETDEKTLELLKETLPKAKRVAMIFDPKNQGMMLRLQRITAAARKLAIELQSTPALSANELAGALTAAAKDPPDVLIVLSPIYAAYRDQIVQFATKTKVPLTVDTSGLAGEPGAVLSYGADISDLFRRAATFVDKILKGARPGRFAGRAADQV